MPKRDASRLRIKFPDLDYDGDGIADASSAFSVCIFSGPNWSGFTKNTRRETCLGEGANFDDWGNLIEAVKTGSIVTLGDLSFTVDWDPGEDADTGGKIHAAFRTREEGDFRIEIPEEGTETAGPVIVVTGNVNMFRPAGTVLSENDEARLSAEMGIQIADISFIAATTP